MSRSPALRFLVVAAVVVGGGVALAFHLRIHPLLGALAGVNAATILLYGYDKAVAGMDKNQPTNEELRRFRVEAAELLGVAVEVAPPPRQKN